MGPSENNQAQPEMPGEAIERPYRRRNSQTADPVVSRAKFDREVAQFKANSHIHRARGIFLLEAEFPLVRLMFTAHHLNPPSVVFGVKLDFKNYDADPPSVEFFNVFSGQLIPYNQMPTHFPKEISRNGDMVQVQNLLMTYSAEDIPFLCIEGVREYHYHPAHTGNSWYLQRGRGKGTLAYVVDQIYNIGILSLAGYRHQIISQVQISAYQYRAAS